MLPRGKALRSILRERSTPEAGVDRDADFVGEVPLEGRCDRRGGQLWGRIAQDRSALTTWADDTPSDDPDTWTTDASLSAAQFGLGSIVQLVPEADAPRS